MKKILIILCLVLLPISSIAEIEKSKLTRQSGVFQTDGKSSSAIIYIGATVDGGVTTAREFVYSKIVTIEGVIEVDGDDVGKSGDIFVVMRKGSGGSKRFYALDESGAWEAWGGSLKTLPIAKSVSSLSESERVQVFTGKVELGQIIIYVGYSTITENSKPVIHVNGSPQKIISYDPCPNCLQVFPTSYENAHHPLSFSFEPPLPSPTYFPSNSNVLADFQQNGTMTLLTSDLPPYAYDSTSDNKDGKIHFYSRVNAQSNWVDITELLLDDDRGCITARKTLIGDFNNDSKPDAFFVCHGTDFTDVTGERDYGDKSNRILLSTESGIYENREIKNDYPWTYSHGGTAFDFNNDGNLDVLATDLISGESVNGEYIKDENRFGYPYLLLGDGQGNFTMDTALSSLFPNCCIFSLEVIDINSDGYLDIWVNNSSSGKEESYLLMNNDGLFGDITRIDLPMDEKYNNAQDMLVVGDDLFTLYIHRDNSQVEYYWGVAVQKVNLKTMEQELIYSHDELYDNDCGKHFAGGRMSWFLWLHYEDGFVMPRNSCSGIKIPIN